MTKKLSLYMTPICPFCHRVMRVVEGLDVEVDIRDTLSDPAHRQDLLAARGRGTVPVLRIENEDGTTQWMPESADIVRFLQENYA